MNCEYDLTTRLFGNGNPHVVLLGSGASLAALPDGDASGKKVPSLDDLPSIAGEKWQYLVARAKPPTGDFETQYSYLRETRAFDSELDEVDVAIEEYMAALALPDKPNLYDYLVLSLRSKDLV